MKKVKIPTIAVLRKAIRDIEENDPIYRHDGNFFGITIKRVHIDKDFDTVEEYEVHYDAKVHCVDSVKEYFDCYMPLKTIMSFLKIPLS